MVTEYTRPVRWMPACGLVGEKRCSGRVGSRATPGSGGETLPTHYPRQPSPGTRRGRGYTSALPQASAAHEAVPPAWSSQVPASSPLPQQLGLEPRPTRGPILEVKRSRD